MGSANIDLVRGVYAPMERGDFSSTDWAHPEMGLVVMDVRARQRACARVWTHGWTRKDDRSERRYDVLNLVHVPDGKVARLVMYPNRERALADLGLAAEADDPV